MPLVTRFGTPASLTDMFAGSVFYDNWHNASRPAMYNRASSCIFA